MQLIRVAQLEFVGRSTPVQSASWHGSYLQGMTAKMQKRSALGMAVLACAVWPQKATQLLQCAEAPAHTPCTMRTLHPRF